MWMRVRCRMTRRYAFDALFGVVGVVGSVLPSLRVGGIIFSFPRELKTGCLFSRATVAGLCTKRRCRMVPIWSRMRRRQVVDSLYGVVCGLSSVLPSLRVGGIIFLFQRELKTGRLFSRGTVAALCTRRRLRRCLYAGGGDDTPLMLCPEWLASLDLCYHRSGSGELSSHFHEN